MRAALRPAAFTVVLSVLMLPVGMPPAGAGEPLVSGWEPSGDPSMLSGGSLPFWVNCSSPGCSTLAFQWFIDGAIVAGETGPGFTFRAGTNLSGTVRISVFVTDGNYSVRHGWNLTVETPLQPLPEGNVSMAEGELRTFRVLGTGGRSVSWFVDGTDTGQNGTDFAYAADYSSAGAHTVAVAVQGAPVRSWAVTVADVNRAPALPQGRLVRAIAGETVSVTVNASDPDGGPLRYLWDIDSDGKAEMESNTTGNLSHRFATAGVHRATLTVTDAGGASAATVYIFEVRERPPVSGWWLPAALAILAALVLAAVVAVQARRLSRLSEARARSGFFATRERPAPEAEGGPSPAKGTPEAAPQTDEEPELLQVRSLLPSKRAELEASADHPESDIPLSKRFTPVGPPGVPEPEGQSPAGPPGGALRDKGAESESRAQETTMVTRAKGKKGR